MHRKSNIYPALVGDYFDWGCQLVLISDDADTQYRWCALSGTTAALCGNSCAFVSAPMMTSALCPCAGRWLG
jgi:hypothetical protein